MKRKVDDILKKKKGHFFYFLEGDYIQNVLVLIYLFIYLFMWAVPMACRNFLARDQT